MRITFQVIQKRFVLSFLRCVCTKIFAIDSCKMDVYLHVVKHLNRLVKTSVTAQNFNKRVDVTSVEFVFYQKNV